MTTKARAETTINKPADEVWARIHNFGDLSWVPGVASVTLDGDQRSIRMERGTFDLRQRLVSRDDYNRTYSFRLVSEVDLEPLFGPGHVLRDLQGTLAVTPKGDSESLVTYDVKTEDFVVDGVRAEYQGAIDNLKALLEG